MITQSAHRAFRGSDTAQEAWVRDNAGPVDLSEAELQVKFKVGAATVATAEAQGFEDGRVTFTVLAETLKRRRLWRSLYDLQVVAGGRVVHTGVLEVVG